MTLSGLIDRLEARGWVERREDPKDRRVKRVWRTDQVKEIRNNMQRRTNELNEMALKGLNQTQIEELVSMLEVVKGNLMTVADEIQENRNGTT